MSVSKCLPINDQEKSFKSLIYFTTSLYRERHFALRYKILIYESSRVTNIISEYKPKARICICKEREREIEYR